MIKTRFALDENNQIADILNVFNNDRKDFICLGCNNIVRPVIGESLSKHFRHKADSDCNGETYLHRLGKKVFEDAYRSCLRNKLPFQISLKQYKICTFCQQGPCSVSTFDVAHHNLVSLFTEISVEKCDSGLIPDITLKHPSGEVIYVEIAVSHKCSDDKKQSGKRIIEINLKQESDVDLILTRQLIDGDERLTFYNFKHFIRGDFSNECSKDANVFTVDRSGKCLLQSMKWRDYVRLLKANNIYVRRLENKGKYSLRNAIEQAHFDGANPRNCILCRYHTITSRYDTPRVGIRGEGNIYCSNENTRCYCYASKAVACSAFLPDTTVFRYTKDEQG